MLPNHLAIDHEPQDILNAIKCQDSTIASAFPHPLPIGISLLKRTSHFIDKLRICDRDLEVWILDIAREAIQVLSHQHLHGVYSRLMLSNLRFQEHLVFVAILGRERVRGSNVEVVKEVGDMQHNRVAGLLQSVHSHF